MTRNILITALFFFGPAFLMFVLRNLFLFARFWWGIRNLRQREQHQIIDISPAKQPPPGLVFIVASLLVGLVCAVLVWMQMSEDAVPTRQYIPAHINEKGELVPGQMVSPSVPQSPAQQ